MQAIISQPRDIAQRLDINILVIFIEIEPELMILESDIFALPMLWLKYVAYV